MTARKIRMTAVGLVAMPVDRDERTITADDLASDPLLCTAWGELDRRSIDAATHDRSVRWAWNNAIDMVNRNDIDGARVALQRARVAAQAAGCSTEHEDAALAMLPPVAGRRAA